MEPKISEAARGRVEEQLDAAIMSMEQSMTSPRSGKKDGAGVGNDDAAEGRCMRCFLFALFKPMVT